MNHIKCISYRTWAHCQLRRLRSFSTASSSQSVQIPARIKRGPTDILQALEETVPADPLQINYAYQDDPFLFPIRKVDYRNYALSYEAGKKAAMWIHKEHGDLFPKHLSDPEIDAFKPAVTYDKSQVSEQTLMDAIQKFKISDALAIYKMLGTQISNETRQALLELLCFYNNEANVPNDLVLEKWFNRQKKKPVWLHNSEVNELYRSLISQGSLTAAAAHNAWICGLIRFARVDEAWSTYQECVKNDVPLNVTTCNYVITLLPEIFGKKNKKKVQSMFDVLKLMNNRKIKPNVRTLNVALRVLSESPTEAHKYYVKQLLAEFKRMNVKFSLATYYYATIVFSDKSTDSYRDFVDILAAIEHRSFTIEDPMDHKFFVKAMYLAHHYTDRRAGDMIHALLLTGDNGIFISDYKLEQTYYSLYISLLLATSTPAGFFAYYENIVPSVYVPDRRLFKTIIDDLTLRTSELVAPHLPRLWADVNIYCPMYIPVMLSVVNLMKLHSLTENASLKTAFADAASTCWTCIKREMDEKPDKYVPIETTMIGSIVMLLLRDDRLKDAVEVLQSTVKQPHSFLPTMSEDEVNGLFGSCCSKQCTEGALLVLEYCVNTGFPNTEQMAAKLIKRSELTPEQQRKLTDLVGTEFSHTSATSS